MSAVAASEAAGISRVTLHRIERGEPTVAVGAWVAVAGALGLAALGMTGATRAQLWQAIRRVARQLPA